MSEKIILDSSDIATDDRTEIDLTCWIDQEGVDWGDAEVAAYMSESRYGAVPVDWRMPNRQVQIPLILHARGGTTLSQIRSALQQKVGIWQREGGWIQRISDAGGTVYADVVDAKFHATSWSGVHSRGSVDFDATLSLSCLPDFYGNEVTLADHTETTLPEITFVETTIEGDYPGRVRVVIDEDDAEHQRSLFYSFRERHYSAEATARMAYEAEAMTMTNGSVVAAAGRSGGSAVEYKQVGTDWASLFTTDISGSALTHTGNYRVLASCSQTSAGGNAEGRLVWGVGDLYNPTTNTPTDLGELGFNDYVILDFGDIYLQPSAVGTHTWQGRFDVRAAGGATTGSVTFDRIWLCNTDEAFGIVKHSTGTALYASQSAELRSEGYFREIAAGTTYAEIPIYGDLPRIPSGTATEVMVKATKAVVGQTGGTVAGVREDTTIDDISARITYRPSWLFVDDT